MKTATLANEIGSLLIDHLEVAETFQERRHGLLGRSRIPPEHGMLIASCSAIHTFFMRFGIDVIFLDKENRVVGIRRNLRPGRIAFGPRRTHSVLEIASGWLEEDRIRIGERLEIR